MLREEDFPTEASETASLQPGGLAPWWHTVLVLVWFVALGATSARTQRVMAQASHPFFYLSGIRSQVAYVALVAAGLYHRRRFFYDKLLRGARPWWVEVLRGAGVFLTTAGAFFVLRVVLHLAHRSPHVDPTVVRAMSPRSGGELALWFALSVVVGFSEELVFRGYLLQQLKTWAATWRFGARSASAFAVVASSLLFGSLHFYEGSGGALFITLLGAIYAMYALRFGNLRAVIVAHFLQDFLAGVLQMMWHR